MENEEYVREWVESQLLGTPVVSKEKTFLVKMPIEEWAALREIARDRGLSVSRLTRSMLVNFAKIYKRTG